MSQCNHGNEVNTNFLCGQENVWKTWGLRADCIDQLETTQTSAALGGLATSVMAAHARMHTHAHPHARTHACQL